MRADASAKVDDVRAKIDKRNRELDVKDAAGDAARPAATSGVREGRRPRSFSASSRWRSRMGLRWSAETVACRGHHCCGSGSENGPDHDVAGIVHAGMDARVGDPAGQKSDRHGQAWQVPAEGIGEGKRRRRVRRERGRFRHRYVAARRRVGDRGDRDAAGGQGALRRG
jgi:hypothetical protein